MNSLVTPRLTPSPMSPAGMGARSYASTPSAYSSQAARYRDAELMSATPGQLIVMLFDKMLLTLRRARVAAEARRIEERCEQIIKAVDMITELRVSLDHAAGGEISTQLDALYGFMLRELHEANRTQDGARIDPVIRIAGELRDAFSQVVAGQAGALPAARIA